MKFPFLPLLRSFLVLLSFEWIHGANDIFVSGNPGTLTISVATAGSQPTSVSDSSTTWSVQTNPGQHTITAALSANLATGITLSLNMAAPSGAVSQGTKALSTTAQTMVTNLKNIVNFQTQGLTYTLAATVSAGVVSTSTVVVTMTLL